MFVNETKNDVALNAAAAKRMSGKKTRLIILICGAVVLLCGLLSLMLDLFVSDEEPDYVLDIGFMVLGAVFLVLGLGYELLLKKVSQKLMQGKEANMKYVFAEDGYEITSVMNDGTTSTTQGSYSAFTRGEEHADMWLLYINKATVFVIRKDGMKEGTAEELSFFLRDKLGDKYKLRCKRK